MNLFTPPQQNSEDPVKLEQDTLMPATRQMLLLDAENVTTDSAREIVLLSPNEDFRNQLAELLRTQGFENIRLVAQDFLNNEKLSFSAEDVVGVIIDIEDHTEVDLVVSQVHSIVSQNIWCCVVGNSDSITLSQKFLSEGILYFNREAQLQQMIARIISGVNVPRIRHTVKISVLSCCGGSGASFISSHLANIIAQSKKVPVLLAQGQNGSQDLDLLFDKRLQNDVTEYEQNLELYKGNPSALPLSTTAKYNFVIFDQPIFNVNKEQFNEFFQHSHNFVLVVERRIGPLRVAKQFLDECERLKNTTGQPIRTFVCISDLTAASSKRMVAADIERLLKTEIDAIIPFVKDTENIKVLNINLGRQGKKEMHTLAMKVIGMLSRKTGQQKERSFFAKLFGK